MLADAKAESDSSPYLVLFDEAHDQYYNYTNGRFKTALDYLNQTSDFEVYLNTLEFTNVSNLLNYSLIIIGNPGPNGNFSSKEIEVLKNYTILGGNLFLLSNYYDVADLTPDRNLTGNAPYLNNLTQALNLSYLFNDYDLHNQPPSVPGMPRWIVEIEDSSFKSFHPIKWKLKKVLTYTSGLNITQNQDVIATGHSNSYLENYEENIINETPWLVATQLTTSRIILCGSTVMFSDLNVTDELGKEYTGIPWINAVDNLRLWANLIQWVLITKTPNIFSIYIIITCIILAIGFSLYIYQSYFRSPKITMHEIKKQNLRDERAIILKEARRRAGEGYYLVAAKLYKKAAKLSNKIGDSQEENLYDKKYRQFMAKSKK